MQSDLFGLAANSAEPKSDHYRVARAGEFFAAYELTRLGADVTVASEGRPYDLLAEVDGRLWRVQVKTSGGPKDAGRYGFDTKHGSHKATAKSRSYSADVIDAFALVAGDIGKVIFMTVADLNGQVVVKLTPRQFTYCDVSAISFGQVRRQLSGSAAS